jgi:Zn-finger nucleic acid-binding protein
MIPPFTGESSPDFRCAARGAIVICPCCKTPMLVVEYRGIELDHCPACRGTWFDEGELALLFAEPGAAETAPGGGGWAGGERIAALPDAATTERRRRCPRCRRKMRKVNIGPGRRVMVDACPAGDGLWFDDREVADLARDLVSPGEDLPERLATFLSESLGGSDAARPGKDGEA